MAVVTKPDAPSPPLGPMFSKAEAELLRSEVFPSYLSGFGWMAVDRLDATEQASRVLAAGPLVTLLLDRLFERMPNASISVFEPSAETARLRATDARVKSSELSALPLPERDESFTHTLLCHPLSGARERLLLMAEAQRVLQRGGQLVFASPLRGSFPEIADMLRECALKHDRPKLNEDVELSGQGRPTPETLVQELERLGFVEVEVDVQLLSVPFSDGRRFAESTLFQAFVARQFSILSESDATESLEYVRGAVSKYWSDGQFDLTVNLGCATARKKS